MKTFFFLIMLVLRNELQALSEAPQNSLVSYSL